MAAAAAVNCFNQGLINLVEAPPRVNMTDAEATAEAELREWASGQKVTMKTVDLLAKEGFNSMEALALLDGEDLAQTKIARGQQKLLLSAIRPLQHKTTQSNMAAETAATCGDGMARSTAADGQTTESGKEGIRHIIGVSQWKQPSQRNGVIHSNLLANPTTKSSTHSRFKFKLGNLFLKQQVRLQHIEAGLISR